MENVAVDNKLDLMGVPICNHRGSAPVGNDISLLVFTSLLSYAKQSPLIMMTPRVLL